MFVGLKSEMYTFVTESNHESKKEKDINKNAVNDKLNCEDYKNVLFNRSFMRHETNRTQSKNYKIGLYRTNKTYLFSYNDKKYIHKHGYSRSLHFYKSTSEPHKK